MNDFDWGFQKGRFFMSFIVNDDFCGVAELKDGREVWVMPAIEYEQWCKGRTYLLDGERYHSGYPVKRKIGE